MAFPEPDSAITRELEPEVYKWSSRYKTNVILADIFDMLAQINENIVASATHKAAKTPPSYPRPGKKKDGKHIGDGEALPAPELRKMFVNKRRQRANNG